MASCPYCAPDESCAIHVNPSNERTTMQFMVKRSPAGWNVYDITRMSKIGLPHTLVERHSTRLSAEEACYRLNNA